VINLGRSGIVVAVELETGKCFVARARDPELIVEPEGPPQDPGEGLAFQMFSLDLPREARASLGAAEVLRDVSCYASASPTKPQTEVVRSALAYRDPAVESLRAEHRPALVPVWPPRIRVMPGALPHYRRTGSSPDLPAGIGVALSVDRVTVLREDARCVVRGSFRLPVREHELVRPMGGLPPATARPRRWCL